MEDSNPNDKVSNQQLLAKKYIEENDLDKIISEMLNNLVHEKVKNPIIYMIKYLAGLITEEEKRQNGLIIPEPYPKGTPLSKYPSLEGESLLKKHLTKSLFNSIKFFKTKHGGNINNILKISETIPEDMIGCLLTDGSCLNIFSELFNPIINEYHYNNNNSILVTEYKKSTIELTHLSFPFLQKNNRSFDSFRLSYSRNIKDSPYCNIIGNEKRQLIETELIKVINSLINEKILPDLRYLTFKDNNKKWKDILTYVQFNEDWNQKAQMLLSNYFIINHFYRLAYQQKYILLRRLLINHFN